jgi:hypothetical protein
MAESHFAQRAILSTKPSPFNRDNRKALQATDLKDGTAGT